MRLNLSIGAIFEKLSKYDDNEKIVLSNGRFLDGDFGSYRGIYEDLYLGWINKDKELNTVGKLKEILNMALDEGEMTGFKGGEYSINQNTFVWISEYGETGDMIIGVEKINGVINIIIKEKE